MMDTHTSVEPVVPETIDGWACLHELFRVRWAEWNQLEIEKKKEIIKEFQSLMGKSQDFDPKHGQSAMFTVLGHKADLLLLHFRETFDQLSQVELSLTQCQLYRYLEPTTSYVSFVELGMYEMTKKIYKELMGEGLKEGDSQWKLRWNERLQDQAKRMHDRIYPEIPAQRYLCFYPMDKKRSDQNNWYQVSMDDRQMMMREHGMVGRKYAGQVKQIISGSIGSDDFEWGVDLFSEDPLVFKKLIYEMRFDRASALYAHFGPFYAALQFSISEVPQWLEGKTPQLLR
ncbi:MAG: heme-dependent peroxidase [Bdellovibrionales bacterium]|nr:heme-dependent peroxidase [Bdellovibrionales bacterium]